MGFTFPTNRITGWAQLPSGPTTLLNFQPQLNGIHNNFYSELQRIINQKMKPIFDSTLHDILNDHSSENTMT